MTQIKPRTKRISLAFMGEGWEACYLDFRALTYPELEELEAQGFAPKAIRAKMQELFLTGQVLDVQDTLSGLDAADLDQLDTGAINHICAQLGGAEDPNA